MQHYDTRSLASVHWLARFALAVGMLAAGFESVAAAAPTKEPPLPELAVVTQAVEEYFQSLPEYQPGDLLSQKHINGALDAVEVAGWVPEERKELVEQALTDGAFLVRELATKDGKKFMRKLGGQHANYLRLDRLTQIPNGERLIRDLVHDKGGEDLIKYLATTQGGHNMGAMLGNARHGVNLNKPTDRIYTQDDLLKALSEAYEAERMNDQ